MIDIDADTRKMRKAGWLRRPELDEDEIKRGIKLRSEVWELPDGRLHTRLWVIDPPNDPEYIGATRQIKKQRSRIDLNKLVRRLGKMQTDDRWHEWRINFRRKGDEIEVACGHVDHRADPPEIVGRIVTENEDGT